jgi:hypothetical protein
MRRPALAPSSSCSTTAIVPSRRTDSWVASQLPRARGAVGAVLGLQYPAPIALHAASPPCPLAIVPPQRGCGHGNLDFLTCAPATACTRRMWAALHFHPVPPVVLHEAGRAASPAHHRRLPLCRHGHMHAGNLDFPVRTGGSMCAGVRRCCTQPPPTPYIRLVEAGAWIGHKM